MNLADLSIKAYSIGIYIEFLDFINIISKFADTGVNIQITHLPSRQSPTYQFEIIFDNLTTQSELILQLESVLKILNQKHNMVEDYQKKITNIVFSLVFDNSAAFYRDQLPLLSDFMAKYQN